MQEERKRGWYMVHFCAQLGTSITLPGRGVCQCASQECPGAVLVIPAAEEQFSVSFSQSKQESRESHGY